MFRSHLILTGTSYTIQSQGHQLKKDKCIRLKVVMYIIISIKYSTGKIDNTITSVNYSFNILDFFYRY